VKLKDRFGSTEYYDYEDYSTGWAKMWTNNAYVTSSLVSPVGSYNGLYSLRSTSPNCYSGTGSGMQIATVMDNDKNVYFGTTKVVTDGTNAKLTYNAMSGAGNSDGACASLRQYRPSRTTGLLMYVGGITQNAANPNGTYVTGQSYMFWREILKYDTTVDYTGEAVASGDAPWGFEYALTSTEDTTLDALDATKKHYGYTRYSSYSSSTTKINDIIVFDPVTTEGAMVIGKDSDLDQRVDGQALAALANREAEEGQDGCPGNAAECDVRPDADLTCTYKKRQLVASFSTKTLDDFEKVLSSYADEETATDSDYTWYLRNSVENAYGTNATVSLADSFLTIEGSGSQPMSVS
jgi:hypothetical protein